MRWQCQKSFHLETTSQPDFQESRLLNKLWSAHTDWKMTVENYSRRNLTFINDRLPALYGLSDALSMLNKDAYLAGLWHDDLALQLLWRHCGKPTKSTVEYKRQKLYRAITVLGFC